MGHLSHNRNGKPNEHHALAGRQLTIEQIEEMRCPIAVSD
jgi:hypothetical protein